MKKAHRIITNLHMKGKQLYRKTVVFKAINKIKRITRKYIIQQRVNYIKDKVEIVPNKIAFMTNSSTYSCNPKYIYEELVRRQLDYQIVWLVNGKAFDYPDDVNVFDINSKNGIREVYSSKIWIDNGIAFSDFFDKKEGQIHIQTMHGSLGIKRLDNAVKCRNDQGKLGQQVVYRESYETDYVLTNSKFEEDVFRTVFWKNTPMLRLGHARTDILFKDNTQSIERIRDSLYKRYGIDVNKKLVLYAPTHRAGLTSKDLINEYTNIIQELSAQFGGEYVILFRMHKMTRNIIVEKKYHDEYGNLLLYDVTDYPDIQELMLVTDVAITDYSSWIYDYVLTRRPGFIYATDIERYNNNTGLYYPLEETPFPIASSEVELVERIKKFDYTLYLQRVEQFLLDKESVDDGHCVERIVDWIENIL